MGGLVHRRPDARNLFTSRGGKDKAVSDPPYVPRTQVKGSVPIPSFELGVFVKLARGYILGGEASREDICLHNAQVLVVFLGLAIVKLTFL